jgi:uncharacterized protein YbaA (DUF1428 family)
MTRYVDGYVLPVPRRNLAAYRRVARKAGRIWREHGALEYRECAGDDLDVKGLVSFPRQLRLRRGETAVFSWIVFRSRADRNRVNARVMKDKRLAGSMDPKTMPFDVTRMVYGGFKVLVDV